MQMLPSPSARAHWIAPWPAVIAIRRSRRLQFVLPAMAVVAALVSWLFMSPPTLEQFLSEDGPVEDLSEMLYVVASALAALLAAWGFRRGRPHAARLMLALSVLMLACAAREMSLHKYFHDASLLKVSFYLGDADPSSKLIGLTAVALTASAAIYVLIRLGPRIWSHRHRLDPASLSLLVFVGLVVITKLIDRAPAVLKSDFGYTLSAPTVGLMQSVEEWGELSLPMIAILGLYQCRLACALWRRPARATLSLA